MAHATLPKTQTAHRPNTVRNAPAGLIFFRFAAEKPVATSVIVHIQNNSSDCPNASSHFGASSGKKAPRLLAKKGSGSTSPRGLITRMIIAKRLLIIKGTKACETTPKAALKDSAAP